MPAPHPPSHVLAAFGAATTHPVPLPGGQGRSWLAGNLVLKLADLDSAELRWQAELFQHVHGDSFRLARPRAAADGSLCVDGWCATEHVAGRHERRRWPEIISAGERFHAALRRIPRPRFLDQRASPWAIADRVAWGEISLGDFTQVKHLPRLAAALRPVIAPSQLIHGDLSGNVLFHHELPPAIIDFSPYWRPPAFASAIVVIDALVWEGADALLLAGVGPVDDFGQHLIRALIFRTVTHSIIADDQPRAAGADDDPWALAVDLACQLAAAGS